jgi:hypothetical protein
VDGGWVKAAETSIELHPDKYDEDPAIKAEEERRKKEEEDSVASALALQQQQEEERQQQLMQFGYYDEGQGNEAKSPIVLWTLCIRNQVDAHV